MEKIAEKIASINGVINDAVWGLPGLILLISTGVLLTCGTKFFQVSHVAHWWKHTIVSVFKKDSKSTKNDDKHAISQFQALCAALAATIGTGNIAGCASALVSGGPGAVFWMWVAAFFGMMTNFSENLLGIYYRRRNKDGEWSGGPMYYLRDGLGERYGKKWLKPIANILAVLFSCFAILASFGIGNMAQVNKIVLNMDAAFFSNVTLGMIPGTQIDIIHLIIGIGLLIVGAMIIIGGLQRIAKVAEVIVPIMATLFVIGSLVIFGMNITQVGAIFAAIFKFAFQPAAFLGGGVGILIKKTMTQGFKRGVFSNEAGLGSSVMVHSNSNVKEPVQQGMWGIFEVFSDTMIVCTMTALVILLSGVNIPYGQAAGAELTISGFTSVYGNWVSIFTAVAMCCFAFSTILGWGLYGARCAEFVFGSKIILPFNIAYCLVSIVGATMDLGLIWGIMAIGLYITYRILNLSDLTVDGSFCTGGVVCVMLMVNGCNVWVAMLGAFLAGMLTGLVTGFFHTKCGIPAILAGILTQLGLWSVNLAIMGMKANQALNVNHFDLLVNLRYLQEVQKGIRPVWQHPIVVVGIFTVVIIGALYWFFGTELGSSIRATGANGNMARAQGINTNFNKVLGLAISNGIIALSGALLAQYQGFADINMGRGAIVIGLAAVIIGEALFGKIFKNVALYLYYVAGLGYMLNQLLEIIIYLLYQRMML